MIDFTKRQKAVKKEDYRKRLKYTKLVSAVVNKIIEKDSKVLTKDDIKEISLKVYNEQSYLRCVGIRRMISTEIVKNDINNELQRILTDAGLDKNKLKQIYETVEKIANDKKDGNLLLKIADKIERANNLTENNSTKAIYRETTDFSKLGKDGQPAQKVTKTLEITKNEANTSDVRDDLNKVNDSVSPETTQENENP